jgi:hypothetical protein
MRIANLGKKLALTLQALVLAFGFGAFSIAVTAVTSGSASAATANCTGGPDAADPLSAGASCAQANGTSSNLFAQGGVFQVVANTLIFLVGAVAVIFLIIGGLRYVVSNGDSKAVEGAKNTILYAIIGIVVAVISFALVSFVITSLNKAG